MLRRLPARPLRIPRLVATGDSGAWSCRAVGDSGGAMTTEFFLTALTMSPKDTGDNGAGAGTAASSRDESQVPLLRSGRLRFRDRLSVLVTPFNRVVGVLGTFGAPSSSTAPDAPKEYRLPFAYGSMLRKAGLGLVRRAPRFLDGAGLGLGAGDCRLGESEGALDSLPVSTELIEMDLLVVDSSMIDGFPEKMTDTILAVSS
jgi:hypothetical protein